MKYAGRCQNDFNVMDYIQGQPLECMAISGLRGMGVERVVDWLIAHAGKK
jgi:hypothetical protein